MIQLKFSNLKYKQFLGPLFKILNLIVFTIISLIMVVKPSNLNLIQQLFIMNIFGTLLMIPWIVWTKCRYLKLNVKYFHWYIIRAILGITGLITWIHATRVLGLNETTLVSYLIPILIILLAALFRAERISMMSLTISIICFIIVLMVINYSFKNANTVNFLSALLSASIWALYDFICKKQTFSEHYLTQAFYILLIETIITLPFILKHTHLIELDEVYTLCIVGGLRLLNVMLLFLAYKLSTLNSISPLGYLRLPFMMIGVYIVFTQQPTVGMLIGSISIVIVNLFLVKYNISRNKYLMQDN